MNSRKPESSLNACLPLPSLGERELLTAPQAGELMTLFKTLANDTRLRMLHALVRAGEMCVSEMSDLLAMKPQAISNQLTRLADRGIVGSRRNGNNTIIGLWTRASSKSWTTASVSVKRPKREADEFIQRKRAGF
jgi:ArsR family transcriptional regulator, lead/cadmium/zinc/bismuth-responsive transcriptional repressor